MTEIPQNDIIKLLILGQIKQSFVENYQNKATDCEGLGLLIARYFKWDGEKILETCAKALEDANFHGEADQIYTMLENL